MSIARRLIQLNHPVPAGNTNTPAIQIPNGATKLTIQFNYSGLDASVTMSLLQSIDGVNYDTCVNDNDEPVSITLDPNFTSMSLNITDLLSAWIKFSLDIGVATTGNIDKIYILMQ
jgi:hypothetical protein